MMVPFQDWLASFHLHVRSRLGWLFRADDSASLFAGQLDMLGCPLKAEQVPTKPS